MNGLPLGRYLIPGMLVLVLSAGCASLAEHREGAAIEGVLREWKAAFLANDAERLMTLYSDRFKYEDRDKFAMKGYMAEVMKELNGDDGRVVVEYATISVEGDKASAVPISLSARRGSNTIGLDLAKEDGRWVIVGMLNK